MAETHKRVDAIARRALEARYGADKMMNLNFITASPSPQPRAPFTWELKGSVELKRRFFGKQTRRFKVIVDIAANEGRVIEI